jgi:uncharacterized membrane protein YhaH (DUF805 family)
MLQSISRAFKNFANFKGRSGRQDYWCFFLFYFLVNIGLDVIQITMDINYLTLVWVLAMFVPLLAVGVRRMHDVGKSGFYLLIPIYSLVLLCTQGDHGANYYGNDPGEFAKAFDFESNQFQE